MSDRTFDNAVQERGSFAVDRSGTVPAESALSREYIAEAMPPAQRTPTQDSTVAVPAAKPVTDVAPSTNAKETTAPATTLSLSQQRTETERQEFTKRFQHDNFSISHFKPGWGPFQALEQMRKDKTIKLTDDQVRDTSRAMRDRDFSQWGRSAYKSNDTTTRWSQPELNAMVETAVSKPKGIDVAHGNGPIDWQQVKGAGYSFAFIKASEGITFTDPAVTDNTAGALKAGLSVGFYHYFRPEDAVGPQAANFVNSIGKSDSSMLRLVVDVEDPSMWKPFTVAQRVKMIDEFCQGVKKATGIVPSITIYGSPSFVNGQLGNSATLGKYDLWVASWEESQPTIPKPWTDYQFWQYSSTGTVPGIKGDVDLDMYNGTALPK